MLDSFNHKIVNKYMPVIIKQYHKLLSVKTELVIEEDNQYSAPPSLAP